MEPVDPERLDLAREFYAQPNGPHGVELQKLLMKLRWDSPTEQFIAVQTEIGGAWYLARITGPRPQPLEVYIDCPLPTAAQASWAVFRKRWEGFTGQVLKLDEDRVPDPSASSPVLSTDLVHRLLLGYADQVSVANSERIAFKVSAVGMSAYDASITRLRCGDHANLAFRHEPVSTHIDGTYPGRAQTIHAGSFVDIPKLELPDLTAPEATGISLRILVWATTPQQGDQALAGWWNSEQGVGFALFIGADGCIEARLGTVGGIAQLSTGVPARERHWYEAGASFDPRSGELWVAQRPMYPDPREGSVFQIDKVTGSLKQLSSGTNFRVAACVRELGSIDKGADNFGRATAGCHYNGKLEAPEVAARSMTAAEQAELLAGQFAGFESPDLLGRWDFSARIDSTQAVDVSAHGRHGEVVNLPTRAMKGAYWDGSEYNFRHAPEHYGAIHFHDDDLYDCGWQTDFELEVPADLPSGLYCAHLVEKQSADSSGPPAEDWVPFVVRPPRGTSRASLAVLLPTAAYWAYANRQHVITYEGREQVRAAFVLADSTSLFLHHHPEFGLSTYDNHSDGSGVCYSSRLRPVLSMRPGEMLWQLPADTHILDWLEAMQIDFDVITEDDLDAEGVSLLENYRCVMTGTHPEYPSLNMMDAYAAYQRQGGRFVYMGGNGFYWRVSYHPTLPGVMEMRRSEDGIRAWLAEGGEYYHGFTGELGGMWRRMGRAPQSVAGTGMTAQGFDMSTYYRRTQASHDPRAAFIFEGIEADERIGDFGIIGGGAAGSEIDRADPSLGTPPHALVVAVADTFGPGYHWMKEELTHTYAAITGDVCPHVHCDMVFYEADNGGAVFSASSIAWAGALAHNDYDNNVSRITRNVLERFVDPKPF